MSCEHPLPPPSAPFRLLLPGGAELVGVDLGALAAPALAPLAPFFRLLDVVAKAVDVLGAIPDAVAVPPDPTAILARLPALLEAAAALAPLLPQVAIPATAVSLLDAVIEELRRTHGRLEALDAQDRRIERAKALALALGDSGLAAAAGCAMADLERAVAGVLAPLDALRGLLGMLGTVLGIAGGPPLPPWQVTSTSDRAALTRDLIALKASLAAVRGSIPLP